LPDVSRSVARKRFFQRVFRPDCISNGYVLDTYAGILKYCHITTDVIG
jgi:hypothetical protein